MAKKRKLCGCPLCGSKVFWTKGNRDTRCFDRVQCLNCDLEMEGNYKPFSALEKWNFRVLDHVIQDSEVNIEGDNL